MAQTYEREIARIIEDFTILDQLTINYKFAKKEISRTDALLSLNDIENRKRALIKKMK